MSEQNQTVRLKVSPEVARIVGRGAPRELQLQAARGGLSLSDRELATALFFLANAADAEVRAEARRTLAELPPERLRPIATDPEQLPQLLDFLARIRLDDPALMAILLANPALAETTVVHVAARAAAPVLVLLRAFGERLHDHPAVLDALNANPQAPEELRRQWTTGEEAPAEEQGAPPTEIPAADEEEGGEEGEAIIEEELNASKYQLSLHMEVAEKIKMALTGDKEWRNIFLKDPNKLVSSAVMKNPRITDGEVLNVAKNKSTSEELIRLILLNREWLKNYELKRVLVMHPRTPLPKALRFMNILSEKDIKSLAKSRSVSQVIVNNARRMLLVKQQKSS
jgi:hypothetical protein